MPSKSTRFTRLFASLHFRLILLVIIAIIPCLALTLFSGLEQRQHNAEHAKQIAMHYVQQISIHQDRLIVKTKQLLATLTEAYEIKNEDFKACSALFATILKQNPEYGNIGLINRNGDIIASALPFSKTINVSDRDYFQRTLLTKDYTVGGYHTGRITHRTGINLSYPVLDNSGQVGKVIFALLPVETLQKMTHIKDLPPGVTLTMIDAGGTVLSRNIEPEKWSGQNIKDKGIIRIVLGQGSGVAEARGIDGQLRLYAFAPLSNIAPVGFVYSGFPLESIYGPADKISKRNLLLLGGVAILSLLAAWMCGSWFIMRQVTTLVKTTESIAGGDLTVRTGLRHSGGEMAQLAQAIDQMADSLKQQESTRREAEEKIKREKHILRDILEDTLAGYWDRDIPNNTEYLSPTFKKMFGYEEDELPNVPETWQKLIFPEDLVGVTEVFDMHVQSLGKVPYYNEVRYRHKDGSTVWVICAGRVIEWDKDGEPLRMVGCHVDITARKKAEAELRKSEKNLVTYNQLLSGILENTHMMAVFLDPEFNFIWVNRAYAVTCGHDPSFFPGKNHFHLYPHEENQAIFQRVVDTGESFFVMAKPFEFTDQPERGVTYWDWSLVPMKSDTGQVTGLVFTLAEVTERIRADEALAESENKYRRLMETANDAIFTADMTTGILIDVNEKASELIGLPVSEIIGKHQSHLHPTEERERYKAIFQKHSQNGGIITDDIFVLHKDGHRIPVEISASTSEVGGRRLVYEIIRDISERKRAEETLRASEEKYRLLFDNAPIGIMHYDEEGTITEVNSKFSEIIGAPKEKIVGFNMRRQIQDKQMLQALEASLGGELGYYEGEYLSVTGSKKTPVRAFYRSIFSKTGAFLGGVSIFEDFTDKFQAEQKLQANLNFLQTLMNAIPNPVFYKDTNGTYLGCNKACEDAWGRSMEELIGKSVFDLHPRELAEIYHVRDLELFAHPGVQVYETSITPAEGPRRDVLLHKATFNNLDGTLAGIIGVEVDITERKRVEQEMKNLAKFPEENPNPVMRVNRDGVLLYANHPSNALLKLWGCEVGHPLPEEWRRNVHESLISVTNRIIEVTTDGQFYLLNLAPIADMDYLNIYVVNITELKQAEERLRESERRFRETLTSLNLIALQLNSEGIIMFANNYLLKIAGCSRDDIIGKNWMDSFIPEEIRESVRQIHWQNCRVGAIRTDYINEICVKDGERLLISWNNSRLLDENGGIIGITSIGLDITEKSRIEDALRQSEIRFRELVENMNSAVAVYRAVDDGDDFVFQEVNRALEGIEKVKEKDILGRRVTEAFPGVRTFGLLNVFQRVYRTGIPERFPATFYQDQRISGWRDNHIYKLPSGEIVAVYDDVTAQKRAEERILASLKEKEVLLKEIHHRVKNNLQIISALMALQTKHDKDKTPAEIFQDCRNRIRSMALIHESLYSTDNLADINFRRYLEKLTSRLLASNASGSQGIRTRVAGADVKLDISQAVPCGLIANELITNSLKHAFTGRPQGEIQVTFQSTAEQRVLEVRDDGLGLGTDFNPETSGTFGWMMVRNLVRQLKGEFSVESNGGTRCKIVF